jgi:hypothetical protein
MLLVSTVTAWPASLAISCVVSLLRQLVVRKQQTDMNVIHLMEF